MIKFCVLENTPDIAKNNWGDHGTQVIRENRLKKAIAVKFTSKGAAKLVRSETKCGREIFAYKDINGLCLNDASVVKKYYVYDRSYCVKCHMGGYDECQDFAAHEKEDQVAEMNKMLRDKMHIDKNFAKYFRKTKVK